MQGVHSLCTKEGAQKSSAASPHPPHLSLCLHTCCEHLGADLIVFFSIMFSFSNVYGLRDWKHLLNCCQARKQLIKLPREKIDHSGVNAGEEGETGWGWEEVEEEWEGIAGVKGAGLGRLSLPPS